MGKRGEGDARGDLPSLIDSATTSPANSLDVGLLASIKQMVRVSDSNLRLAFHALMEKLKYKHSQVRYLALLIADELFTRSKLFRALLVEEFETFMLFSVGYRSDFPLPPPVNRATMLRAKSTEILEKWNDSFGPHYKPLRLGYEYLKNTLHLRFPNLRQAAAQAEQQRKEREARSRALVLDKFEALKCDFPAACADIQQTVTQLDECFELLNALSSTPKNLEHERTTENDEEGDISDDDFEDYEANNSLRTALEKSASLEPVVTQETQENQPVFDTIRDLYRLIVSQHFPALQNWMSILIRVDVQEDREAHDTLFKQVIDIRNHLSSLKTKCLELGIEVHQNSKTEVVDADDDIIWEEGGCVDGKESTVHQVEGVPLKGEDFKNSEEQNKPAALKEDSKSDTSKGSYDPSRKELLNEAPILPWGSYLDRWGAEHEVPVNQRGLLLETHWGKVDFDALFPAEKVTEMNMRAFYYTSEKLEIRTCLAPLKNGGLCQRRDLRVCPFHGPIKPRDSNGNLISMGAEEGYIKSNPPSEGSGPPGGESSAVSTNEDLVKEIMARAAANVRAQDAIESSRKRDKKLQAKRNREHNVAVLREAALLNTRQGLGEALGENLERYGDPHKEGFRQQSKRARASLKAMLQPKPTAKDRIAEKLLSSGANEATVRVLTRDEDAAYRESFSNQW